MLLPHMLFDPITELLMFIKPTDLLSVGLYKSLMVCISQDKSLLFYRPQPLL